MSILTGKSAPFLLSLLLNFSAFLLFLPSMIINSAKKDTMEKLNSNKRCQIMAGNMPAEMTDEQVRQQEERKQDLSTGEIL